MQVVGTVKNDALGQQHVTAWLTGSKSLADMRRTRKLYDKNFPHHIQRIDEILTSACYIVSQTPAVAICLFIYLNCFAQSNICADKPKMVNEKSERACVYTCMNVCVWPHYGCGNYRFPFTNHMTQRSDQKPYSARVVHWFPVSRSHSVPFQYIF